MDFQGALWDGHKGNYLGNGHNGMATRDTKGLFRELFGIFQTILFGNYFWGIISGFFKQFCLGIIFGLFQTSLGPIGPRAYWPWGLLALGPISPGAYWP